LLAQLLQVYNKWQDDSDSLVASGALPLQQVLQLSQVDHPATAEAGPCSHTFLVPLQLLQGSEEAAVQQQGVAVLLQVTVSYFAENCYSLEEDEELLQQQEEQQQQQQEEEMHDEQPGLDEHVSRQAAAAADQWQEAATDAAADPAAACAADVSMPPASHRDGDSSCSSSSGDSDSELEDLVSALRPGSLAAVDAAAADGAAAGAAAEPPADAAAEQAVSAEVVPAQPQLLQAALCVEVVRACGLQVRLRYCRQLSCNCRVPAPLPPTIS
jgi:hypothetical protein